MIFLLKLKMVDSVVIDLWFLKIDSNVLNICLIQGDVGLYKNMFSRVLYWWDEFAANTENIQWELVRTDTLLYMLSSISK